MPNSDLASAPPGKDESSRIEGLAGQLRAFVRGLFSPALLQRPDLISGLSVILSLAALATFFTLQNPNFLSARNLSNLILQIAVTGTVAIGVVLVLLIGEIDLSIGSVLGLTSAVFAVLVVLHGVPWWLGIVIMLLVGAAIGAFQGSWVVATGVPSFVVTLAGLLAWLGVQLHLLLREGSNTINVVEPEILAITNTYLPTATGWALAVAAMVTYGVVQVVSRRSRLANHLPARSSVEVTTRVVLVSGLIFAVVLVLDQWRGIPTSGLILVGLVALFAWVTRSTQFGRHMYAIGGNAEAARRAGIKLGRIRIAVFTLSSVMAAVAGLLAVSRSSAAGTLTGGGTLLLEGIAAAVIGGTSLFGGRGTVWAALLGAVVIGSVSNGLDLIGQPSDVKFIVQGGILLLAVTLDSVVRRASVLGT